MDLNSVLEPIKGHLSTLEGQKTPAEVNKTLLNHLDFKEQLPDSVNMDDLSGTEFLVAEFMTSELRNARTGLTLTSLKASLNDPSFKGNDFIISDKKCHLTPDEWRKLTSASAKTAAEFRLRKSLLLTRLNASIQSFLWSDRGKRNEAQITQLLHHQMEPLRGQGHTDEDYLARHGSFLQGAPLTTREEISPRPAAV